jgi:small GTP-binding protein
VIIINQIATKSKDEPRIFTLKLCTLGDGGVGKSTFIERVATGKFNSNTMMTIGIDFKSIHIVLDTEEGQILTDIAIWDLGGESQFRFILPTYISGADGGLLLFDVNRVSSMKNLQEWIDIWVRHTKHGTPLYLIGAKHDLLLPNFKQKVYLYTKKIHQELKTTKFFLTSSKTGEEIHEVIINIVKDMLKFKKIKLSVKQDSLRFYQK